MASVRIVVDSGEQGSGVVRALEKQGVEIEIRNLEAGDYVTDNRIAFERMALEDLLKSFFEDRKLFSQIKDMESKYERPVLIIEGEDPFFSGRTINPASIQGFLTKIAVSFRVPVVFTLNENETADIISSTVRAGQSGEV